MKEQSREELADLLTKADNIIKERESRKSERCGLERMTSDYVLACQNSV
jgi:hypothetical protein